MRILISSGASGGHVFPAVFAAQELRKEDHEILFITTKGLAKKIIEENQFNVRAVDLKALSFSSLRYFIYSAWLMVKSLFQCLRIIVNFSPSVVVGFGGYASFPAVLAAWLCHKPIVVHEQNIFFGKANRLSGIFSRKILISFKETQKFFSSKKFVLTGCPCRSAEQKGEKLEVLKKFNLQKDIFTILVLGGSQGSQRINDEFIKSVEILKNDFAFQCIHLCGELNYPFLKEVYRDIKICYCLIPFLKEIEFAYQVADLVVARSGAMTIFELMCFKKRSILIPYPFAGGHQNENARILEERGLASIIKEKELSPLKLSEQIKKNFFHTITEETFENQIQDVFISDASKRVALEITKTVLRD